jgi:CBS domain-containing protein
MMATRVRTVESLRPKPGLALDPAMTVAEAARKMLAANSDCALVVSASAELKGILTDTDVTHRLLAPGLDPEKTLVSEVMTASPQCVRSSENAVDALCTMVERRFRHLPVLDAHGAVVGVLDIAKCLYDAISRLERHLSSASTALSSAILTSMPGGHAGSSAQQMVDGLVQKLFAPTLADLLHSTNASTGAAPTIGPGETAQLAAQRMAERKSALLVASASDQCVGILTPKDLLFRLVAKGLGGETTPVDTIMTRAPDTMPSTATVLQALHQLQYGGYRNVPVVGSAGEPLGVLDVLTLMEGALHRQKEAAAATAAPHATATLATASAVQDGWRGLLGVSAALGGSHTGSQPPSRPPSQPPSRAVSDAEAPSGMANGSGTAPRSTAHPASSATGSGAGGTFLFKVHVSGGASDGSVFRIHSHPASLSALVESIASKTGVAVVRDETCHLPLARPPPKRPGTHLPRCSCVLTHKHAFTPPLVPSCF